MDLVFLAGIFITLGIQKLAVCEGLRYKRHLNRTDKRIFKWAFIESVVYLSLVVILLVIHGH